VDYDLQNEQVRKQVFLEQTRVRAVNNYLKSTRTRALGKYEVKMGWDIPAILEQGSVLISRRGKGFGPLERLRHGTGNISDSQGSRLLSV